MTPPSWFLTIDTLPESYNRTRYAHWATAKRAHDQLSREIALALIVEGVPRSPVDRVTAGASLRFPTRRRRDSGNYRTPLEKSLGDCLVAHGLLADDTHDQYELLSMRIEPEPGAARTLIMISSEARQ